MGLILALLAFAPSGAAESLDGVTKFSLIAPLALDHRRADLSLRAMIGL
jgi:hypothetical protein